MKNWKIIITVVVVLMAASLAASSTYALHLWGLGPTETTNSNVKTPNNLTTSTPTQTSTLNPPPVTQTNTTTPVLYTPQLTTPEYSTYYAFFGCEGTWGYTANNATAPTPLTINQATQIATIYVTSLNNPDLKVTQIDEYTSSFYVIVSEKSSGYGAFTLLISKYSGVIRPEMGPNMMWNTKYTFTTGYCNWLTGTITATPTITVDQAKNNAQQYLNLYLPGMTAGNVTTFYGHYTVEVLSAGNVYDMLSVNANTGQVWYHTWHDTFIQEIAVK